MSRKFPALTDRLIDFIRAQYLFFVADSRVNISPKGIDSLQIINTNRVM